MLQYVRYIVMLFLLGKTAVQAQDAMDIMLKTVDRTREIKTLSFVITKNERIDGELVKQVSFSKVNRKPLKVYLKQQFPKDGMEVLFKEGGKVLVNPNGFPWFNIKLSPLGNLIRENQHHTILESGFDHVINVLEHIIHKYGDLANEMLYVEKDSVWDGHEVWKIKLSNPSYYVSDYVMKEGETVMQVARRDMLSEYWLVEQNKALSSCNDKKPGATIKRPSDYAPTMELYIDKVRMVPLIMKIYDGQGLFEYYAYTRLKIDPDFKEEEFSRNYAPYGF